MKLTAQQAIHQSIMQDEIVTIEYSPADFSTLLAECDDNTDDGNIHQFWGAAWRVHVTGCCE